MRAALTDSFGAFLHRERQIFSVLFSAWHLELREYAMRAIFLESLQRSGDVVLTMQRSSTQALTSSDLPPAEPEWVSWPDEKLLDLPMCRLGVDLENGFLSKQIEQLYTELEAKQLTFRPHF